MESFQKNFALVPFDTLRNSEELCMNKRNVNMKYNIVMINRNIRKDP